MAEKKKSECWLTSEIKIHKKVAIYKKILYHMNMEIDFRIVAANEMREVVDMTILIEEIIKELNSKRFVKGKTEIGAFMGRWMSRDVDPEIGKKYTCELSLPDLTVEDMRVLPDGAKTPVYTDIDLDDKVVFKGMIWAAEQGGVVVSFAPDWIECFEIRGSGLNAYDSVMFVLDKEDIRIYPYDVE